jgi:hypothetical protein
MNLYSMVKHYRVAADRQRCPFLVPCECPPKHSRQDMVCRARNALGEAERAEGSRFPCRGAGEASLSAWIGTYHDFRYRWY